MHSALIICILFVLKTIYTYRLRYQVQSQDGVTARGVLVHLVGPDSAVLHAFVQYGHQVVDIGTLHDHEILNEETLNKPIYVLGVPADL